MAMAALRREGRWFLLSPVSYNSSVAARSAIPSESTSTMVEMQVVRRLIVFLHHDGVWVSYNFNPSSQKPNEERKEHPKDYKGNEMVAASKLRAVQVRTENSCGFWQPFTALLGDTPSVDVKKNVIVTITSDKGLCGGINSTPVRVSKALCKLISGPEKETKYVILGEKGKVQLVRDSKNSIELNIAELQKNPLNYTQVSVLADDVLTNVEYDALSIVYNKFQSVVSFVPTSRQYCHLRLLRKNQRDNYEIEGGETKAEVLQNLAEQFSCVLFNAVRENACSELGARMSAMDSSSRNAGEMLDRLTVTYNRTRQASITTELIEIISGASALTG